LHQVPRNSAGLRCLRPPRPAESERSALLDARKVLPKINHDRRTVADMDDPPIPTRTVDQALSELIATAARLGPDDPRTPRLIEMIRGLHEFKALTLASNEHD
jgi:hypothetical protein